MLIHNVHILHNFPLYELKLFDLLILHSFPLYELKLFDLLRNHQLHTQLVPQPHKTGFRHLLTVSPPLVSLFPPLPQFGATWSCWSMTYLS
jgi:hypothetical protein